MECQNITAVTNLNNQITTNHGRLSLDTFFPSGYSTCLIYNDFYCCVTRFYETHFVDYWNQQAENQYTTTGTVM